MSETIQRAAADLPSTLHLGCGAVIKGRAHNVDIRDGPDVDETVDLDATPWPWPDDTFSLIVAEHVFEHLADVESALRECARVLEPGGRLRTVWPMGQNAWEDPDHERRWHWDTPARYCGKEPWDVDVGLTVERRDASLHTHGPGAAGIAWGAVVRALAWHYDAGRWMFDLPATSGEFEVVFRA